MIIVAQSLLGLNFLAANGLVMPNTAFGTLQLSPALPTKVNEAFILDNFYIRSLISLSQLCDDICIALFTKYNMGIIINNQVLLIGQCKDIGIWYIPLAPTLITQQANGLL